MRILPVMMRMVWCVVGTGGRGREVQRLSSSLVLMCSVGETFLWEVRCESHDIRERREFQVGNHMSPGPETKKAQWGAGHVYVWMGLAETEGRGREPLRGFSSSGRPLMQILGSDVWDWHQSICQLSLGRTVFPTLVSAFLLPVHTISWEIWPNILLEIRYTMSLGWAD